MITESRGAVSGSGRVISGSGRVVSQSGFFQDSFTSDAQMIKIPINLFLSLLWLYGQFALVLCLFLLRIEEGYFYFAQRQ